MRTRHVLFAVIAVAGAIALAAPAGAADDAGKEVFLAQKCNLCHTVSSAGIEATTTNEKLKGPDLSTTSHRDAAWLEAYLKQEETIEGAKHKKKYNGSDEDLHALVHWLQAQTAD